MPVLTKQQEVEQIREALHARRTGKQVVKASSGGRSVDFAQMTMTELEAALSKAEAELAGTPRRGAIKPYF